MKRFSKITTTQLARICGVSQGTVDRALHNRSGISPETRERILEVAREYDYVPTVMSSNQPNSMLIGVVLFDLYNEYFSKLAMSLVNAAKRSGYSIVFQFSDKSMENERAAIEYFDYIGVDGIILFSIGSDSEEYSNYLHMLKKPLVLIGNKMFDLPYIGIDDEKAMYDLTIKLSETSDNGVTLYYAPVLKEQLHKSNAQKLRLKGFTTAMAELNRSCRIATSITEVTDFDRIICPSDYYVLKVMEHLNFPNDVVLAGFDNTSLLKILRTPILTVEYSTDKIAEECINYILGRPFEPHIEHKLTYNTK